MLGKHHGTKRRSSPGQQDLEADQVRLSPIICLSNTLRFGVDKARNAVRERLGQVVETQTRPERIYARIEAPVSRLQAIKQAQSHIQSRQFSTQRTVRHYSSKPLRSSYPASRTRSAISASTGRTPFASTLRPNLTGGTLSRSAGGYGTGAGRIGGKRFYSHGPASPAEVVNNVSQAVRAFWLQGHKARFDGYAKSGSKRYRAISQAQETARNAFDMSSHRSAGSFVDFVVSPTITAVGPLATVPKSESYEPVTTIDSEFMTTLSVDFARALKDLAAIMSDLKRLAALGSLPLVLVDSTTLRVRFPGCDRDTVESLCTELGVKRGIIGQDEDFRCGEAGLQFPYAPSKTSSEAEICEIYDGWRPTKRRRDIDWQGMVSEIVSEDESLDFETVSPRMKGHSRGGSVQMSDYSSLHPSEHFEIDHQRYERKRGAEEMSQQEYEGIEGIYKFIEQCDGARR